MCVRTYNRSVRTHCQGARVSIIDRSERDELGLATWALFLRTHAAVVSRLEREMEDECRLPLTWYDVLLELNSAPGRRLRMQELGNRVVLSRTRVSRIVDELVGVGLARREPDVNDGRGAYAVLTEAGRSSLRSAAPIYLRGISEHFTDHLDQRQLRMIHDALAGVLAAHDARYDNLGAPRADTRRPVSPGERSR